MMSQFGGKVPPPWQTRTQTAAPLQTSLLGQHPGSGIPNQQIILGTAPQTTQYTPVQQSIIQPPGLGGLQNIPQSAISQPHHSQLTIPQSNIGPTSLAQSGQPTIVQASIPQPNLCQQGGTSLMGQPPLVTQSISTSNLASPGQLTSSQIQQIQPQVTTIAYPTSRSLAPPGSFSSQGVPVIRGNISATINSLPAAGIIATGSINGTSSSTVGAGCSSQSVQKQRVFTGSITKLCADFGFVDEDVFFQTSCVKGHAPKVGDRVLVEASYNPNMPFKWNANRVQVIPGPMNTSGSSNNRSSGSRDSSRNISFNAVPPPNFSNGWNSADEVSHRHSQHIDNQSSGTFNSRSGIGQRPRSPRRDRREDLKRGPRERLEREEKEKEKDTKRDSRKRSRSRDRSRSPVRRRARIVPRYNVQVPKIMLHIKEANVLELRKRYSNLYVPSDVFLTRPLWSETFPAHRSFQIPRPVSFHIMNKEVDPVFENNAIYDPPDINHTFAAKVMLMAVPSLEDIYRRSCALSEEPSEIRSCFVHPTRLINFLVGLKGKNETMAIGGYWSPSLDGPNPDADPNVLVQTAIRSCKALTGIDLSGCTTWYRFAEIYYRRGESTHKGRIVPARVETTVIFLPDVWNICPTKLEWESLHLNYRQQLDLKLQSSSGGMQPQQLLQQLQSDQEEPDDDDLDEKETVKKDPTHYSYLDPKNMKVLDLRCELDSRFLNSKGLKSQLIARLTKVLKSEQEKEEQLKSVAEKLETDESRKKDEEDKKKEEDKLKKEEEEKKREKDERRKAEEKERGLLEKRHTLPDQPMIVVHPSRNAKAGKFDCTTMSLSVLLDYRQEDNKEHSFEVSLFAELFNEMLMRDFAFKIYKAMVEAPDKNEEKKESKDSEKEKKEECKDEREDKKEIKDAKEEKEKSEENDKKEKGREKDNLIDEKEKEDYDDEEEMDDDDEDYLEDEDSRDKEKDKEKGRKKDERKELRDMKREKKDKKKMVTLDPHLLLSFVYFDQTHTGYIVDKDLEDITNILGLNLSRAQLKKLVSKVVSRNVLYYRKLTDVSPEDRNKVKEVPLIDYEQLTKGNNHLLPVFYDSMSYSTVDKSSRKSPRKTLKDEPVLTSTGVVKYEGSLVDIGKLMQQLERSEKARCDTEDRLQELQKELGSVKEEAKKSSDKNVKLGKEVKVTHLNLKSTEDELKKALEDNAVYQKALNQINCVIRPLCAGVDTDEDDLIVAIKEDSEVKIENDKIRIPEP